MRRWPRSRSNDYTLDSIKASPDKVEITGDPQAISSVNFLDTEEIPLAKMTDSGQKTVKIIIPDGIAVSKDTVNESNERDEEIH